MASNIRKWTPEAVLAAAVQEEKKRMGVAVALVVGSVKRSLNRSNRSGRTPSLPSEPPRKRTGNLQRSITGRVVMQGRDMVVGVVGTNRPYARRLELGFFGTDARGAKIRQGARPYLRPGVIENAQQIKRILGSK